VIELLRGIRVLECAVLFNGDQAGRLFGDLGADVIKIESPGAGEICVVAATEGEIAALAKLTGVELANADAEAAADRLDDAFRTRKTAEWLAALGSARVPAAVPLPNNNRGFLRDPANQESGRVAELPHAVQGRVRELARLVRVSDTSAAPHRLAPELGAHSDEILGSLGYARDQIAELRARGALR
jgi:crotonobetainyl-CoA:carnitine CoA-transferase CaiB-like acyl-CoA transferase